MKRVISIFAVFALMLCSLSAQAQLKVLEKSSKRAPAWLISAGEDYFVVTAVSSTLEDAKSQCIEGVKRQIIEAVAVNVKSATLKNTTQQVDGLDIASFNEEFISSFETRSAIVPFLQGISMSKAEDFYYVKNQDKATKQISYSYSILYPFSKFELNRLIAKFDEIDAQMEATLNQQELALNNITSTEDIDRGILAVKPLLDYFFDDVRLSKAKQLYEMFQKQYSYINLELVNSRPGSMTYALMLGSEPIATSTVPQLTSDCAMSLTHSSVEGNMVEVKYDNEGCLKGEDSWIEVKYRFSDSMVRKKLYPQMTIETLRLQPTGDMLVKLFDLDSAALTVSAGVEFSLNYQSDADIAITSFTVKFKEFDQAVSEQGLDIPVVKGVAKVALLSQQRYNIAKLPSAVSATSLSFTSGSMDVTNLSNGVVQTIPLVMKYNLK